MKHALLDRKTGFTLIEICVVVVILAIVSATILPEFTGSRDSAQVRAAARELAMVFRLAASRAITTGLEQRVRLDEENSKFWIESRQT
ncbi:MAG: prepilin-type N-terminal cleavage/methylation domain-containing protein, partial [Planctomycetota bacterium]